MLIDTHVHLNDPRFDPDRDEVIARAAGCLAAVVEIADSPREWDRAIALSRKHPGFIWCTLGLHPYHAAEWRPELARSLEEKSSAAEVVAVGEIGLDYAKCEVPKPVQMEAFKGMARAAQGVGLPVVVHCRDAYGDLVPALRELYEGLPRSRRFHGVVHCFSGSAQEARACVGLGFALGADGPVTYPKNGPLREALVGAGLGALVLETDSPWLPPQSKRGKRCEPADVAEAARAMAAAFGVGEDELARATSRNARELYGLPPAGQGLSSGG
ncbi:MAG: TatD family hydrolase [Elusimicrobia bacterium]|nr:TatD family hydrolase [Elusimicrobiota bacterium]